MPTAGSATYIGRVQGLHAAQAGGAVVPFVGTVTVDFAARTVAVAIGDTVRDDGSGTPVPAALAATAALGSGDEANHAAGQAALQALAGGIGVRLFGPIEGSGSAAGPAEVHWTALTRNLLDGDVPVDNNHLENQIRPWAMGRRAWLFTGSELAGQRAAVVTSLVQSAKLNGHDPHAYLSNVLERLPTHRASRIEESLPHRWHPPI